MSSDLAVALGRNFIQRKDVKAIQLPDGSYVPHTAHAGHGRGEPCNEQCQRVKWSMQDIEDHIAGRKTYGHYMVGTDDMVKFFAFDIDLRKEGGIIDTKEDELVGGFRDIKPREVWLQKENPDREWLVIALRCMAEGLAMKAKRMYGDKTNVQIAHSGRKGLHVYVLTGPIPAADAKQGAIDVLEAFGCFRPFKGDMVWEHDTQDGHYRNIEIEIFPKQGSLEGKDLGNLMRLPLGIHRASGDRGFFLDCRCGYNQLKELDPMTALTGDVLPWGE